MIWLQVSPPPAVTSIHAVAAAQATDVSSFVAEASQRFGIPEPWILAVIDAESRRNPLACSPKGALGLMQLMPRTWMRLRATYGLGDNPLDPHDNIIAGTAYLRELFDQYGADGFLAAYNAGPRRYAQWLDAGLVLPLETRTYVRKLSVVLGLSAASQITLPAPKISISVREMSLFVAVSTPTADPASASPVSRFAPAATPFVRVSPAEGGSEVAASP